MNLASANAIIKPSYRRATELIIQHMKEMGVFPLVGLELEFYAFLKEYGLELLDRAGIDEVFNYLKAKDPILGHLLQKFCVENVMHAYELVTKPGSVDDVITVAERMKALILSDLVKVGWADKISFSNKDVIWDGEYFYYRTKAMHCGVSLNDSSGNIFASAALESEKPISASAFANGMIDSLYELSLLIFPYQSSYDRMQIKGKFSLDEMVVNLNGDGIFKDASALAVRNPNELDKCYIENRLPGSDIQPYKSVFVTLFAAYDSYLRILQPTELQFVQSKIPDSLDKSIDIFRKGTILKDRLNKLEEGLGDRIYEAELVRAQAYSKNSSRKDYATIDFRGSYL